MVLYHFSSEEKVVFEILKDAFYIPPKLCSHMRACNVILRAIIAPPIEEKSDRNII